MLNFPLTYASSSSAPTQQITHFSRPPLFPDGNTIKSTGENLIPLIMRSTQFRSLAQGMAYHEKPYSSFGFTSGPDIPTTERVILFSPDESSYIITEVEVPSNQIQTMYFVNSSQVNFRFANHSDLFAGWRVLFCTGTWFGSCVSTGTAVIAIDSQVVPSSETLPAGANSACCAFGEWDGASNDDSFSYGAVQGGVAWSGMNLPQFQNALSDGYVMWTEYLPAQPMYIAPPSWMGNMYGLTINLTMEPYDSCSPGNLWYAQVWNVGNNYSTQFIKCDNVVEQYAWYVFESPPSASCQNGGYYNYCQIPSFPTIGINGQICLANGQQNCRNINSYSDPIQGYYIQHHSVDATVSDIPGGSGYFTVTYHSST